MCLSKLSVLKDLDLDLERYCCVLLCAKCNIYKYKLVGDTVSEWAQGIF